MLAYSFVIFPELVVALLIVYSYRRLRLWKENSTWQIVLVAGSLAFLPWLGYRYILPGFVLFMYYLYQRFKHKETSMRYYVRDTLVLTMLAISASLQLRYNYDRFGVLTIRSGAYERNNSLATTSQWLTGLFLDQHYGLFVVAPVFLLSIAGFIVMIRRSKWVDLIVLASLLLPYVGLAATTIRFWGGWSPPSRFLIAIIPLFVVPFVTTIEYFTSNIYKVVCGSLLSLSIMVSVVYMVQPQAMYTNEGVSSLLASWVGWLPSFASIYYQQDERIRDLAVELAWESSVVPVLVIVAIILTLFLRGNSKKKRASTENA